MLFVISVGTTEWYGGSGGSVGGSVGGGGGGGGGGVGNMAGCGGDGVEAGLVR